MTLINMKNRYVVPLHQLAILAIRYVYDKKHMKADEIDTMHKSMVHWSKKIDLHENELHDLQTIAKFLKTDEEGGMESRKDLFKKHKINYMQFHRMPHLKELGEC